MSRWRIRVADAILAGRVRVLGVAGVCFRAKLPRLGRLLCWCTDRARDLQWRLVGLPPLPPPQYDRNGRRRQ